MKKFRNILETKERKYPDKDVDSSEIMYMSRKRMADI